jgi:Cd2+/Zn2+-exporting ATPase
MTRTFRPDMNLLMMVAVIGAIIIGEWFEAAAVTFRPGVACGILERWSSCRAIKAQSFSPTTARCIARQ